MQILSRATAAIACMAMAAPFSINATSVRYSPSYHASEMGCIGTGYSDSYDVALLINGDKFANSYIKAVEIPFAKQFEGLEIKVWTASQLNIDHGSIEPEYSSSATVVGGVAVCDFPDPLFVPEGGIYIGYSFEVAEVYDDETAEPVLCRKSFDNNGLYLHAKKRYTSWTDISATRGLASAITVVIEGDFNRADMSIENICKELNVKNGEDSIEIPVSITSYGESDANSLSFSYSINGNKYSNAYMHIDDYMLYGQPYDFVVSLANYCSLGDNCVDIRLDSIDGESNNNESKSLSQNIFYYDQSPQKHPLIEEYTGLWCNYCARGFAALEYMNRVHPNDFIGVAFHHNDAMSVTTDFPSDVPSYPYAYIDREWNVDPYYGRYEDGFIENDWLIRSSQFTPIDIKVSASIDNDGVVTAESGVSSIKKLKNGIRIFYYLVADGLSDTKWIQGNAFGGYDPSMFIIPEMEKFCNAGTRVRDLVFDDVVVMLSNTSGFSDNETAEIEPNRVYNYEYIFDTTQCKSIEGTDLKAKASALKVVAGVVDVESGVVLNVARCVVDGFNQIDTVNTDKDVCTDCFDLYGRQVSPSHKCIKICRRIDSYGKMKTTKIWNY